MKFKVVTASQDAIEVWDGKTIDEWRKPSTYTFFGDFSEFAREDEVELVVRKVAKPYDQDA